MYMYMCTYAVILVHLLWNFWYYLFVIVNLITLAEQGDRERERDRDRDRERQRQRQRDRETETERQREDTTEDS